MVNLSGTITLGGTAQTLTGYNPNRIGLYIQNYSSQDIYINFMGAAAPSAATGSIKISSGVYFEAPIYNDNAPLAGGGPGTGTISIYGATTGQEFSAAEW